MLTRSVRAHVSMIQEVLPAVGAGNTSETSRFDLLTGAHSIKPLKLLEKPCTTALICASSNPTPKKTLQGLEGGTDTNLSA